MRPMNPTPPDYPDEVQDLASNPAALLLSAFFAAAEGRIPDEEVYDLAADLDLARSATPESCAMLAQFVEKCALLAGFVQERAEVAVALAEVILIHANTLRDLGRCREALVLHESALPVIEQHGSPELVAKGR